MSKPPFLHRCLVFLLGLGAALCLALVSGCGALVPKAAPPPRLYVIQEPGDSSNSPPLMASLVTAPYLAPMLIVHPTRAAPGFDSQHIIYVRVAHQLEHFAHADWVDTPAHMLMPLIVATLQRTGSFRAVGTTDSDLDGELRLDTEVIRLQQQFGDGPSQVRFTLRARLSDNLNHQVISWQEFDETSPSATEDPYGGVVAANQVVQRVMAQLASYCALAAASRRTSQGAAPHARQLP